MDKKQRKRKLTISHVLSYQLTEGQKASPRQTGFHLVSFGSSGTRLFAWRNLPPTNHEAHPPQTDLHHTKSLIMPCRIVSSPPFTIMIQLQRDRELQMCS